MKSNKDWTNLNPTAPPFEPKNPNKDSKSNEISETNAVGGTTDGHTDTKTEAGASVASGADNCRNRKTINKINKKPNKPSIVTLEQIISEKLKLDNSPKQESNQKSAKAAKSPRKNQNNNFGLNALDSSAPTRKRGKERETPKPKRPTAIKKIINSERSEKSDRNVKNDGQTDPNDLTDSTPSDTCADLDALNKKLIHNKSYRDYCQQRLSQDIDELVTNLLTDLVMFQDRMFSRDPVKAQIRRRLSFGFKEVTKYAKINKLKLLVIAPDIEKIESKGGLDDCLSNLIDLCKINDCPIVFALNRQRLGITCKKKGFVSCVGVLNYDGTQVCLHFARLQVWPFLTANSKMYLQLIHIDIDSTTFSY